MRSNEPSRAGGPAPDPGAAAAYSAADRILCDAAAGLRILRRLEPRDAARLAEGFLESPDDAGPPFSYSPRPEGESAATARALRSVTLPDHAPLLRDLLVEKRDELLLENAMADSLGDRERMTRLSTSLYGVPDAALVAEARAVLTERPPEEPAVLPATTVRDRLAAALEALALDDWKVEWGPGRATYVDQAARRVLVCRDRTFRASDAERLAVHEVGVHVVRAVNGYRQPLALFAIGLPGYVGTEEGLASYAEQITGTADVPTLRTYAGRVVAVDALVRGASFGETWRLLGGHGFGGREAYDVTLRAFRGGGMTKDYLYLAGLLDVRSFVSGGGDVRELMAGKYALAHLPAVTSLTAAGVLSPPYVRGFPGLG